MKPWLAGLALLLGTAALSGCYDEPGYSYVRSNGYSGDAYYGSGRTVVYDDGYYAPGYVNPGYYAAPGYYGYAPGVSVGIGTVWYGGSRRGYGHGRDYDGRSHDGGRGEQAWRAQGDDEHHEARVERRRGRDHDDRYHH